jgi:hypothetical protein
MMVFDGKHALSFSELQQWAMTDTATMRLLLACALGGVIGLDRECHRKPSGVRTNLLICFAAALFTYLSPLVGGELSTSKGQIASNIVQGVGFMGAGLILAAMDAEQRQLKSVDRDNFAGIARLSFTVMATRRSHQRLTALKASGIDHVLTFRSWEDE